jgi:hypothetical protein
LGEGKEDVLRCMCTILALLFCCGRYLMKCSLLPINKVLLRQSIMPSKSKLGILASYLHYCRMQVVHLWTIHINSLHHQNNVVVVVSLHCYCLFMDKKRQIHLQLFFFVHVGCSASACISLKSSSLHNPWTFIEYYNPPALSQWSFIERIVELFNEGAKHGKVVVFHNIYFLTQKLRPI